MAKFTTAWARQNGFLPPSMPKAAPKPPDGMNKLERAYKRRLELLEVDHQILWHRFSPGGLRLAQKTFYHPDFLVVLPSGEYEFHETKGFMRDDANVKLKVAAEAFPFRFVLVQRFKGQWAFKQIPGLADRVFAGVAQREGAKS